MARRVGEKMARLESDTAWAVDATWSGPGMKGLGESGRGGRDWTEMARRDMARRVDEG